MARPSGRPLPLPTEENAFFRMSGADGRLHAPCLVAQVAIDGASGGLTPSGVLLLRTDT